MKRILTLILVAVLCIAAFTSCDTIKGWFDQTPDGPVEPTSTPLDDAKAVLVDLYKDKSTTTAGDFDVVGAVMVDGVKFTVTWKTNSDQVVIKASEKEGAYTVDVVPAEPESDIPYTLTATITDAEGNTIETSFNYTVPKFQVNTYAEYVAAEEGKALVVEGIVYGIMSKAAGDKENSVFVQDLNGDGGYYVYAVADDPADTGLKVGQTVRVRGLKAVYNGTLELKEATIEVRNAEIATVTPVDFTKEFTAASAPNAAALVSKLGMFVTIKGVTILGTGDNGYYYFELDGVKTYLRISSSSNCTTSDEEKAIINNHADKFYYTADVTGIAAIYGGNFYIMPVTGDAFSNFSAEQLPLPDDVKASMVKDDLTIPTEFVTANPYTLPAAGEGNFADVAITWAVADTSNATLANGVLTPVIPAEGSVNVVLTATITKGETSLTKEFTVKVTKVPAAVSIETANTEAAKQAHNTYTADKFVVEGTIKEISNTTYGNMTIQDANGNTLTVYGSYDEVGVLKFGEMANAPKVGDTVVLYGVLGTYNSANQMKNAWIIGHTVNQHVCEFAAATCVAPATCSCGKVQEGSTALGHNKVDGECATCHAKYVTLTEAVALDDGVLVVVNGTVKTINDEWSEKYGNITVTIEDSTGATLYIYRLNTNVKVGDVVTITGKVGSYEGAKQIAAGATAVVESSNEGGEEEETPAADPNSIEAYAAANGWVNSTLYDTITLANGAKVTCSGTPVGDWGQNTGKFYTSDNTWRIYQNENPSVVITAAEGKTIASVKITYNIKNDGTLTLNGENIASGTVVTVNANSITFSVGNTGTKTNGQAQITAIEVVYN